MNEAFQETEYALKKIDIPSLSYVAAAFQFFDDTCIRHVGEFMRVRRYDRKESDGAPEGAPLDAPANLPHGETLTLAVTSANRNKGGPAGSKRNRMLPGFGTPVPAYDLTQPDCQQMRGEAFNKTRSQR
ncbi:hypothetical protein [Streptomyces griseofuscus]|uniref:hypothetical protein n=1 Tax=Streptomyces griseofuscus TaxID=146922 RepID=UPI00380B613D